MLLFYIRHGDPIYKPDQLTPLGHRQAESVAKRLSMFGVDEIYSSTSIRAMQTAQPTCEYMKMELKTLDWMHETYASHEMSLPIDQKTRTWCWAHPKYSGILASREVREMGDRWYEHPDLREYNLDACPKRVGAELDKWLAGFGLEHDRDKGLYKVTANIKEKRIALFAHEGVGKVFMSELLDIPFPYYAAHFDMKHSGMTVISFDEGRNGDLGGYARARVLTLSNDSHLYRDGLPTDHASTRLREKY
ncbi:MAG: histidine phosphatase family protein [Clostridia bacterium]|nr:histidine phosphatase family protein [Clostridia bacterium]